MNRSGIRTLSLSRISQLIALLSCVAMVPLASAHDPGLSTGEVRLNKDNVEVMLVFAVKDAGELANSLAGVEESWTAAGAAAVLSRHATNAIALVFDGRPVSPAHSACTFDEAGNVTVSLKVRGVPTAALHLRSEWLAHLPLGHRQFATVQRADGSKLMERMLSAREDSVSVENLVSQSSVEESPVGSASGGASSFAFLVLGLKHILIGYDHLLFLFSLLIVSRTVLTTFKVISVFTVAHSITLALATLDVVRVPGVVVEPLIAASIVFVALENVFRRKHSYARLWLVFGFGLIHGLGFASVLGELGVGRGGSGIAWPLLSFNLGVELGQFLVALPFVALLTRFSVLPGFERRWVPVCSTMAALAGGFWLVERLMG